MMYGGHWKHLLKNTYESYRINGRHTFRNALVICLYSKISIYICKTPMKNVMTNKSVNFDIQVFQNHLNEFYEKESNCKMLMSTFEICNCK